MDYTELIEQVHRHFESSHRLLEGSRLVACLGSRLALNMCIAAIRPGQQLVGAATGQAEAMALMQRHQANVLLCTDRLEQGCGIALVEAIKQASPQTRTLLIVSEPNRRARLKAAIQAGCDGLCLEAQLGMGTVLAALTAVSGGGIYIERSLGELFLANAPGPHPVPLAPLSEREIQVLQLAAGGHSNQEIGARLFIALETVKTHMRNILQKLQARDRTHAAVQGLRLGLVDWPEPG